ncbi:MinD/ParA family protein [Bacillus sp. 179-C3.3 HS]|uniref:MinD/ParA family protein n=1 Tax=Bacillus sp. 179-C3.3 HS TaxID=3232162 RepID=UPI00399FD667
MMKPDQAEGLRKLVQQQQAFTPVPLSSNGQAKTIAVMSGKGGVGKSNLTLNMALSIASTGKRVLIIDLDFGMGNIDILLGKISTSSILDVLVRKRSFQAAMTKGTENLYYISGGSGLEQLFSLDKDHWSFFLEEMERMVRDFDCIFFDMGAGLSKDQLPFVLSAEEVVVVTTPEPTSIMDAYSAIKHLVIHQFGQPIQIIVNRCRTTSEGPETYRKLAGVVSSFLHRKLVFAGAVPDDSAVPKAVSEQIPFYLKQPHSRLSKTIKLLAETLYQQQIRETRGEQHTFIEKLSSFFKRRKVDS